MQFISFWFFFWLKQDRGYPFRGRGVVRGVRRPQVKVRPRPGKSKTTAKPKPNGKGRGTTIEIIEYVLRLDKHTECKALIFKNQIVINKAKILVFKRGKNVNHKK